MQRVVPRASHTAAGGRRAAHRRRNEMPVEAGRSGGLQNPIHGRRTERVAHHLPWRRLRLLEARCAAAIDRRHLADVAAQVEARRIALDTIKYYVPRYFPTRTTRHVI